MMKSYLFFILIILIILHSSIAIAERLTVSSPIANIRSGPGSNYDIIWKVEKFHPLFILEKPGPWYHFRDFEGDEGWVHKSLLEKIPSVITISEVCNVRSGPGAGFEIVFTVGKGIPFKVIKHKGNWIHVQHADGDQGWIHKTLVW